jgi:hypothetical protein
MRFVKLAPGLGAVAVSLLLVACDDDGSCDQGERCGYRDSGLSGHLADWSDDDGNFANEPNGDDAMRSGDGALATATSGDRISSVTNREAHAICFYADSSYGGDDTRVLSGRSLSSMPGGGTDVGDNEASSQRGC